MDFALFLENRSDSELRATIYRWFNVRVPISMPREELLLVLAFEYKNVQQLNNEGSVNNKRLHLINFILKNKDRLSLPCSGDCYEHSDATVLHCFAEWETDNIVPIDPDALDLGGNSGDKNE